MASMCMIVSVVHGCNTSPKKPFVFNACSLFICHLYVASARPQDDADVKAAPAGGDKDKQATRAPGGDTKPSQPPVGDTKPTVNKVDTQPPKSGGDVIPGIPDKGPSKSPDEPDVKAPLTGGVTKPSATPHVGPSKSYDKADVSGGVTKPSGAPYMRHCKSPDDLLDCSLAQKFQHFACTMRRVLSNLIGTGHHVMLEV